MSRAEAESGNSSRGVQNQLQLLLRKCCGHVRSTDLELCCGRAAAINNHQLAASSPSLRISTAATKACCAAHHGCLLSLAERSTAVFVASVRAPGHQRQRSTTYSSRQRIAGSHSIMCCSFVLCAAAVWPDCAVEDSEQQRSFSITPPLARPGLCEHWPAAATHLKSWLRLGRLLCSNSRA